jgi:gamma-glutamyltranspeptidase/glutathione hydrolase
VTRAPRGVISASHPLAAEAGASILRSGGNAVDAAAAVQFALNVVEPLASGLGGGAFSLIRLANGETTIVDSRERAPASARPDQFLGPDGQPLPVEDRYATAPSVGVPGTLLGQAVALQRWGTLGLAAVLKPAIELAEQAVPVSTLLASQLAKTEIQDRIRTDPLTRETYLPAGQPLQVGGSLRQPDLARTLRLIADRGPDAFYRGPIARAMVNVVNDRGGALTLDDLAAYRVELRRPLLGTFRDYQVATMPPPGSGLTLLQMLGLVEPLQLSSHDPLSAARLHLELQAMRLALVDRAAVLGDPAYTRVPSDLLLDGSSLAERRQLISTGALQSAPAPGPAAQPQSPSSSQPGQRESGETTHFVVVDRWGNLVSCTSTIE